jgi:hypothetical protein
VTASERSERAQQAGAANAINVLPDGVRMRIERAAAGLAWRRGARPAALGNRCARRVAHRSCLQFAAKPP